MEMEKKETISVLVARVDWISAKQQEILRPEKDTFSVKEPES